ncbi:hypothetical protein EB093_07005 [bacterium]|nr:hypothetical protein [bacterium]
MIFFRTISTPEPSIQDAHIRHDSPVAKFSVSAFSLFGDLSDDEESTSVVAPSTPPRRFNYKPTDTSGVLKTPDRGEVTCRDFFTPPRISTGITEQLNFSKIVQSSAGAQVLLFSNALNPRSGIACKSGVSVLEETRLLRNIPSSPFITSATPFHLLSSESVYKIEAAFGSESSSNVTLLPDSIVMPRARGDLNQFKSQFASFFDDPQVPSDRKQFAFWSLLAMMSEAIFEVNSSKYIHRDIKPANFLLFERMTISLTDFGEASPKKKAHDDLGFTPDYAPPEFYRLEVKDRLGIEDFSMNYSSDIWSLGASVHDIVFGYPYYKTSGDESSASPDQWFRSASSMAELRRQLLGRTDQRSDIKEGLDFILQGALHEQPNERIKLLDICLRCADELSRFDATTINSVKEIINGFTLP